MSSASPLTPHADDPPRRSPAVRPRRVALFRWKGIIPLVLGLALAYGIWRLFGERVVRDTVSEAGTKALGTEVDVAELRIHEFETTVELRGIAIADPFDARRNLVEAKLLRIELEPEPLLEKKLVVKRLTLGDVRTGTARAVPARPVTGGGFAPGAIRALAKWKAQFDVPLLSLTPIDTIKSIALDPMQLRTVQAALGLARDADTVRAHLEAGWAGLKIEETLDSSRTLVARLQKTSVRALGLDGARTAVADVKRAVARVDSAKRRVEALAALARRGVDTLQAGVQSLDEARRGDYAFARGLLQLPSFDAPDMGAALFGTVTIDRFQQALYWTMLARKYAPPGLLPKPSPGPQRLRRAGTTVHFVNAKAWPRFLLQRADVNLTVPDGPGRGAYVLAVTNATTEPALVGKPTVFALRRTASGSDLQSLRVTGLLDHVGARPRDVITVQAEGVKLPDFALPMLPYRAAPGRGASALRMALDGDRISGRWTIGSGELAWVRDSSRTRPLNTLETLVARVITGIPQLDLTADIDGTIAAPRLAVRSNLDRVVADRLRAVAGEELVAAEAKVRAQVDRLVEEKSAPVKQRIADLRAQSEQRVADARARLDAEKQKLDAQLKALTGGLLGLPKIPGA